MAIRCEGHGVTTELLESGRPIQVVTRMMRHGDSKITLDHYAHVIGDTERVASEKFSQRIGHSRRQSRGAKSERAKRLHPASARR
jgi:hypothetical protein